MKSRKTTSASKPTPPPEIAALLAASNIDAVEEAWLAHLEDAPDDIDFFIAVAKGLAGIHAEGTAGSLLELLDDQLCDTGQWESRLRIMQHCGKLYIKDGQEHKTIMDTLESLYGELPSYSEFVDKVGLLRAVDDRPKNWKKVARLQSLVAFDVGAIVYVENKGIGRVLEVNMALESFKIKLETMELRVGFGGAAKLLRSLPEDHILYRKMTQRDTLEKLRDEDPSGLLRIVLESYEGPRTGAEVKKDLVGLVAEGSWSRWWTAARKHPQVLAAPGNKRAYTWAASTADAEDAVWESFKAADVRERVDLFKRDGTRDEGLRGRMAEVLIDDGRQAASKAPGLACEIWFTLEKFGEAPAGGEWSPDVLVGNHGNPQDIFNGIQDRVWREKAYEAAKQQRDDWDQVFFDAMLQETDRRALDGLSKGLIDESPELFERFLDQLLSQARKSPGAFTWFAEKAADTPEWLGRNPLRLMQQILSAMTANEFASIRAARLVPLCESGGTLPRLLDHLGEDQAAQAMAIIEKSPGLEDYQREPLLNAIQLRFPNLREEEAPFYATRKQIDAKSQELKTLAEEEIPANRRAIEEAREMGDLRENFEYKSARQRHEYLSARGAALQQDLRRVRPIDPSQVTGKEVVIGSQIHMVSDGEEKSITILGPWDSEPEKNILSNESRMAKSLLGLAKGASVDLEGKSWTIQSIEPYAED